MKKNIGIIYDTKFNENDINGACGGSETWIIQISKEFVRQGYNVVIFRPGDWVLSPNNVEYVPFNLFEYKIQTQQFECIIFSRNIDDRYFKILESKCTKNIYIQAHEIYIWKNGIYNEKFDYNIDGEKYNIKKYIALSDFHKQALNYYCNIPLDKIEIIGNAVDTDVFYEIDKRYGNVNYNIEHSILWSSCFGRGCDILIDDVLPIVKKDIPDIKVKICGYVDVIPDKYRNHKDIEIIGFNLSKENYYKELRKCSCWFYPCVTAETFNISALDAAVNNCDIISPMIHGMETTFKPFLPLSMSHKFGTGETLNKNYDWGTYNTDKSSEEYKQACKEAAELIVDSMNNYFDYKHYQIRVSLKNYILQEHTWENVVKKWKNMLNNCESGQD